ncbi:MAG: tRNA uridine-5-carboxymethylaminomethyl(34) synthesis GTPase MnmE [Gemmatimonadota bacterium]
MRSPLRPGALKPDTIAALATPSGRGALALVRLSGPDAASILRTLAPSLRAELPPPRTARLTTLLDPESGELLDRAIVLWFPGPASYTGDDVAELTVHGGPLGPALVLDACLRAGARPARAGEFTQRAYLNGKVDLVQAEGVRDLIDAESEAERRAALAQTEGGLSRRLAELRGGLVHLEALLVYHLDFPDEDEPPVPLERIAEEGRALAERLGRILATAPEGELLHEGALSVLAGRPNSGKSSLFNALLGEARAIVTEEAGTTRDAIEARISLGGFPFRLIDTAGIRTEAGRVERLGMEVARRYLARADLVLLCLRADEGWSPEEEAFVESLGAGVPILVLRTMMDRAGGVGVADAGLPVELGHGSPIGVSVETGEGLDTLRERLPELVFGGLVSLNEDAPVLTRRRQRDGIRRALDEVSAFVAAISGGVPAEVASAHLRAAETALEELLGTISGEEVLDRVFADFCIGK